MAKQVNKKPNTKSQNRVYYGEYSLKHWIDLILSKNLVLPDYQRYFVWNEKKVKELVNTLKNKHFIPPVTIGFYNESDRGQNLVLDGQQRLTSILLTYLKIYPEKEKYKKEANQLIYSNSMDEQDSDNIDRLENVLEWDFSILQELGKTKSEILSNKGEYYKIMDNNIDDDFFENNYLGFCYLVPSNKSHKEQQNYYSTVFRSINIQGQTLLPQESRASLYYLDKDMAAFFEPEFMKHYKVTSNNIPSRVDFIRYLALVTQYEKSQKDITKVAKGYKSKLELFYEEYIYSVINSSTQDSNRQDIEYDEKFGSFYKLFSGKHSERVENFKKIIVDLLGAVKEFKSIIDADLYFFGSVYYILIEGKIIDTSRKDELISDINSFIENLKADDNYTKSPNDLSKLRNRIEQSISLYKGYVK
jgi:hypothetical protein BACCOPRO_01637